MKRALLVAVPLAVAVVWFHLFATTSAWASPVHRTASAVLQVAALATAWAAWRRAATLQLAIAGGLLAIQAAIIATSLAGIRLVAQDLFPDHRLATVVGIALVIAVLGLARGRVWGRWLGLALAAAGAASGGLNLFNYWSVTQQIDPSHVAWSMDMFQTAWLLAVSALGGTIIVVNLASPALRERFAARGTPWASNHRLVGLLRATIIAAFAAVPMLLVYAWLQPIAPATRDSALVLAAALAVGGTLAVRGKVIGALLLVVAGAGLLAQTAVTALSAMEAQRQIAGYYAVFWIPAGILAIAAGVRMIGPLVRLLRRDV